MDESIKGLGDLIAKATKAVGIKECGGCKKRKEFLNKHFPNPNARAEEPNQPSALPYRPSVWTVPGVVPNGWVELKRCECPDSVNTGGTKKSVALFQHTSGKIVIWHEMDGRYANSHSFCCAALMDHAVKLWSELCR